jgi:hypothetical protein
VTWLLLWLAVQQPVAHYRQRAGWLLPDSVYTPGKVALHDTAQVCHTLTSTERHTRESLKEHIRREYGGPIHPKVGTEEVDHLVPLTLGGADDSLNLWMQPSHPRPGFREKDVLEGAAHRAVCQGRLSLDSAQRWIAHDFPSMYDSLVRP